MTSGSSWTHPVVWLHVQQQGRNHRDRLLPGDGARLILSNDELVHLPLVIYQLLWRMCACAHAQGSYLDRPGRAPCTAAPDLANKSV